MMKILLTILFILTDIILYIYLANKYKTYNPIRIAKFWMKEYM